MKTKRSSSVAEADVAHLFKRRRIHRHHIQYKQSLNKEAASVLADDIVPQNLLTRALSLALQEVGFEGAEPVALEMFRAQVEEYMSHFLSSIMQSMLSCRRSEPIPQDFAHALSTHGLTTSSLETHLQPSIPPAICQPTLPSLPLEEPARPSLDPLLGPILSGAHEKAQRSFVPSHFPPFPSKHTYKDTPIFVEREEDPRKIRERATEEGRLGEEALRRLVGARKTDNRNVDRSVMESRKGKRRKEQEEMWEKTLAAVTQGLDKPSTMNGDRSVPSLPSKLDSIPVVNSDRVYWRKGSIMDPPHKLRKPAAVLDNIDILMKDADAIVIQ
ncbi:MAG: hypothetical protein M1827_003728 [Pycnora praestabilis]|nr:MAG: hypothetical protein M1827_003728 [Pycnora praestabilis]